MKLCENENMKITMKGVSGFSHNGSNTQFRVHNSSQSSQYIQYSMRSPREIEPIILVILVSCATHIDYAHCMEKTACCEYRNVMMLFSSTLFLLHTTSRANIVLKVFLHHHYVQASPYLLTAVLALWLYSAMPNDTRNWLFCIS